MGVVVTVLAGLVQVTLSSVFRVALYRFATQDAVLGRFTQEQLRRFRAAPRTPRDRLSQRPWR